MDVGQFSETGADAVNDGAACNDFLDDFARSIDRLLGRGCDLDGFVIEGDAGDLRER